MHGYCKSVQHSPLPAPRRGATSAAYLQSYTVKYTHQPGLSEASGHADSTVYEQFIQYIMLHSVLLSAVWMAAGHVWIY